MSMCRVFSCVVGRWCLLWPVRSLGKTLLAFALLHSVLQRQICLLLQVCLDFISIYITESLCCTPETSTILKICVYNYTPIFKSYIAVNQNQKTWIWWLLTTEVYSLPTLVITVQPGSLLLTWFDTHHSKNCWALSCRTGALGPCTVVKCSSLELTQVTFTHLWHPCPTRGSQIIVQKTTDWNYWMNSSKDYRGRLNHGPKDIRS